MPSTLRSGFGSSGTAHKHVRSASYLLLLLLGAATSSLRAQAAASQVPATAVPVPVPFASGADTTLGQRIATLLNDPAVNRAHWSIAVTALDGTPIYGLEEGKLFRPASNAKLFTTAAAMQYLGATELETRVAGSVDWAHLGPGGVLQGNLLLAGRGDANLSGRTLPYMPPLERRRQEQQRRAQGLQPLTADPLGKIQALAADLVQHGLKHVTGDLVGDDTLWPWEPYVGDWSLDDASGGDGPPVSALSILDNVLTVNVAPGAKPGSPAAVSLVPEIGYYTVVSHVLTAPENSEAHIRIDHDLHTHTVRLSGTIALGKPYANEVSIDDPAEFAAMALKKSLETLGVQIDGEARAQHRAGVTARSFLEESQSTMPPLASHLGAPICSFSLACEGWQGQTLATIRSPTLLDDVTITLKVSQNLHAELLLRRLGKLLGEDGSVAQGARVIRQYALKAGISGNEFVFYDGSGLSSKNVVTPRAITQLLAFAAKQSWFESWKAALPLGGLDGSLAGRFTEPPLRAHVFAKTGTLGESRALSGYLDGKSGRTVIFSILVDNHTPGSSADRGVMDEIVAAIQNFN